MTFRVARRERTIGSFDTVEKFLLELDDANAVEAILSATFGKRVKLLLRVSDRLRFIQKRIRYEIAIATEVATVRSLSANEMLREIATIEYNIPAGGTLRKVLFAGAGDESAVAEVTRALRIRGIEIGMHDAPGSPVRSAVSPASDRRKRLAVIP